MPGLGAAPGRRVNGPSGKSVAGVGEDRIRSRSSSIAAQPAATVGAVTGEQIVYGSAALALALVVLRPTWVRARHVLTIVHEGAHGVAALLTGRRLGGIRLHSDTSGVTVSRGRPTGPGMVVTAAAGYVGPGLLGLLAAHLVSTGRVAEVLWVVLGLLLLLVIQIRNWFGVFVLAVAGGAAFAVTWWASVPTQAVFAYTLTWFLLLGAPRPVVELQAQRRRRRTPSSDADQLARLTHVPALLWVGFFLFATVGCLLLGARWLLG